MKVSMDLLKQLQELDAARQRGENPESLDERCRRLGDRLFSEWCEWSGDE